MDLIGLHVRSAPHWPLRIIDDPPNSTIKIHTCNRYQILSERKDSKHVLKLFSDAGYNPMIWSDRECMRKVFEIANGMDSVSIGNPIIRQQITNSRKTGGTPRLKRVLADVVDILDTMYHENHKSYLESCRQFLHILGFSDIKVIDDGSDESDYMCQAAILYSYVPGKVDISKQFKFFMNVSSMYYPSTDEAIDLTPMYRKTRVQPLRSMEPIADLYYDKIRSDDQRRSLVTALRNLGLSSGEIEHVFKSPNVF